MYALAIALLDDANGISEKAYQLLLPLLNEQDREKIVNQVRAQDGRWFVPANPVRDSYEDKECPDCRESIPHDVESGDECFNCGHVFTDPTPDDDNN